MNYFKRLLRFCADLSYSITDAALQPAPLALVWVWVLIFGSFQNLSFTAMWLVAINIAIINYAAFWFWRDKKRHWYAYVGEHRFASVYNRGGVIDDDGLDQVVALVGNGVAPQRNVIHTTNFRTWVCGQVKAVVGTPTRTMANELMVAKVIRDVLIESNVRKAHWAEHIKIISYMVLTPNNADLEAIRYLCDSDSRARMDFFNGEHWSQKQANVKVPKMST